MADGAALYAAPPEFDAGPAERVALISLASDPVSSDELRRILAAPDRAIHEARILNSDRIDRESLAAMEGRLTDAAALLPSPAQFDVAAYLCTSASMIVGSQRVAELVGGVLEGARVSDPMRAAAAALRHLGISRIGLVTPYVRDVTLGIAGRFGEEGVDVARAVSFFVDRDSRVARITPDAICRAAAAVSDGAEAVFVSCTALRTVGHIAAWERQLDVPVISSNQAVAWKLLADLEGRPAPGDWGRLFAPRLSR